MNLKAVQTAQVKKGHENVPSFLDDARNCVMAVDLKSQDRYPEVIRASEMQPDIVGIKDRTAARFQCGEIRRASCWALTEQTPPLPHKTHMGLASYNVLNQLGLRGQS